MADLLNAIIRKGGTTAFTSEITGDTILEWFGYAPGRSVWHVAEDDRGTLLGFQSISRITNCPPRHAILPPLSRLVRPDLASGQSFLRRPRRLPCTLAIPGSTPRSGPITKAGWPIIKVVGSKTMPAIATYRSKTDKLLIGSANGMICKGSGPHSAIWQATLVPRRLSARIG